MSDLPPIDFKALNDALLRNAPFLVEAWLPGGERRGGEYVVHSPWRSEKTASLSVRLTGERAGRWGDFGGDRRGGDLVSLYAELHGLSAGAAAVELARLYGLEDVAGLVKTAGAQASAPRPPPPPPPPPEHKRSSESWKTAIPVPSFAPAATFKHFHRQSSDITHLAEYRVDGHLMGYVVRFRTSEGGKETLPYTWCISEATGTARWSWRQWDEPRPLYYPGGRSPRAVQGERMEPPTVIVVEGERKAGILQQVLDSGAPGVYVVASWPGGSKAWSKALWDWLAGCSVVLWPDCDGKREPLTREEQAQLADDADAKALAQATKPLLPAAKQVGMVAMHGIGALLREQHGCKVQLLPIPEPGEVEDGWDVADAIEKDGWDFARLLEFFGRAQPFVAPPPAEKKGAAAGPAQAGGGGRKPPASGDGSGGGVDGEDDDEFDGFRRHLEFVCEQLHCKVYHLKVNRKMVIAALRKSSMLIDCVGFNELTEGPETRVAWPWRSAPAPLIDSDPLRLGDFLSEHYKLPGASKASLEEAIDTVADANRFHPIRDWLEGLKHDGKSRIDRWLIYVLRLDANTMRPLLLRYLELVGRYMLLGLVARVMTPGCKFDYTPVLEGKGGLGKSTLIKELVGRQYFSDTHFELGSGKDPYEQLAGIWGYELSEMTALRRADSEQAKQFLSSQVDRFRGAYGRYAVAHPRQCVIFCSTNKKQYLYDLTGNRRYWPLNVPNRPNLEWLVERREQLFAEAVALFKGGARIYPTPDEEEEFFVPEQRKRLVETAVQARLYELLTREGARANEGRATSELSMETAFVTIDGLVVALGADAAKSTAQLESQIKGWLEAMDWGYGREGGGQRRRGYKRPKVWPPALPAAGDEDDDAAPADPKGTTRHVADGEPGVGEPSDGGADGAPF